MPHLYLQVLDGGLCAPMVGHGYLHELIQRLLKLASLLIKIYPLVGILGWLTSLLLVELVPQMIPRA